MTVARHIITSILGFMADLKLLYKIVSYIDETNMKSLRDPFARGITDGTHPLIFISETEFISNFSKENGLDVADIEKALDISEYMDLIYRHKLKTICTIEILKRGFDFMDTAWWGKKGYWREVVNQENSLINLIAPLITGIVVGVAGAIIIHWLIGQ